MFEHITTIELAGYGVGAFLLCATISAPKIDSLISTSQRSSMGMCKRCGDLKMIACSGCKGLGLIKEGNCGIFSSRVDSICHSLACVRGVVHFWSTAILTGVLLHIETLLHKRGQSFSYPGSDVLPSIGGLNPFLSALLRDTLPASNLWE